MIPIVKITELVEKVEALHSKTNHSSTEDHKTEVGEIRGELQHIYDSFKYEYGEDKELENLLKSILDDQ